MTTIVKFIATHIGGFKERYTCNTQGDLTGEYVPLAEYQALEELFRHAARQYTQADPQGGLPGACDERGKLEADNERLRAELDRMHKGLEELAKFLGDMGKVA